MIGGIYTAEIDRLSLLATFPQFREMTQTHGSLIRAMRKKKEARAAATATASGPRYSLFLAPLKGMSSLVRRLVEGMPEVVLKTGAAVSRVEKTARSSAGWSVTHADGVCEADAVCLATPAPRAAEILSAASPALSRELAQIPYESVVTVNIACDRRQWKNPLRASGFVVPAVENRPFVGCTFSSLKFPGRAPEGAVLLRVFAGGALHPAVWQWTDEEIRRRMVREVWEILGLEGEPLFAAVHRHPQSMPQDRVGHLETVSRIEEEARRAGLFLTGNAYRGIGIPDCVRQAETAAEAIAESFSRGR
jgi:oxygen-dependent protoporphyrinogen oxidase